MCLSPEVDVVAATAIAAVAVDAWRHNPTLRTAPIAALPTLFAVHTFSSALVWWGLSGSVPPAVGDVATFFFMFVAFVLLPVYVPVAVLLLEPEGWRRYALTALAGAGLLSAVEFFDHLVTGRAEAAACDYYIRFTFIDPPTYVGALYVVATIGALLLSGQRVLVLWGLLNAAAVALLLAAAARGLPSLWCFWAALTSVMVAVYLRRLRGRRERGGPWPWEAGRERVELTE